MLRITFTNGIIRTLNESEIVFIRNFPPSETPKPGYEKTREYPPEWSRFTPLRASVLTPGHYVRTGDGMLLVEAAEVVTEWQGKILGAYKAGKVSRFDAVQDIGHVIVAIDQGNKTEIVQFPTNWPHERT